MSDIYHFNVYRADAKRNSSGGLTIRLFYPDNPEPIDKRLPEDLEFGVQSLTKLKLEGEAEIADKNHPIKPASAGSLFVLQDGVIVCHRRDKHAPTHALYHSASAGFTNSPDFIYTAEGLLETALRESAEECLLVTKDNPPYLIVPNDSSQHTLESARNLGLNLKPRFVDVETLAPQDTLEVYNESGGLIFRTKANLEFIRESQTSLNALWVRKFPLTSDEVLPIDAEGAFKDANFVHFNRESYLVSLDEIRHMRFGSVISFPRVYQTKFDSQGLPQIFTPEYTEPNLGPGKIQVINPHIWAPENLLTRTLDSLGVAGYNWLDVELWKEGSKLEGKSLLPEEVLKTRN